MEVVVAIDRIGQPLHNDVEEWVERHERRVFRIRHELAPRCRVRDLTLAASVGDIATDPVSSCQEIYHLALRNCPRQSPCQMSGFSTLTNVRPFLVTSRGPGSKPLNRPPIAADPRPGHAALARARRWRGGWRR